MDKKTNVGLVICFGILLVFWWLQKPSEEERERWTRYYDSLARVEQLKQDSLARVQSRATAIVDTVGLTDSAKVAVMSAKYGLLGDAVDGTQAATVLENSLVKIDLTNKGGKILNAQLKEYQAYGDRPLQLYGEEKTTKFGFYFVHNNRSYFTNDLYFTTSGVKLGEDSTQTVAYTLQIGDGALTYTYTLRKDVYEVDLNISAEGVGDKISTLHNNIDLEWEADMPAQEKGWKSEGMWSNIAYRYADGDVEELSTTGNDIEEENMNIDWVAYKNQFFSTIFVAKRGFAGATMESTAYSEGSESVKNAKSTLGVKFDFRVHDSADFQFLFLPNYFYALDSYEGMEFTNILPMGWGIFRWVNEWFIIPVFKHLESVFSNYGVIILLLTLLIKLILFPLTFSSFKSQAKMKVLRPQVEEINQKIPAEKALERQQATMALYKKAGVSPMSGCLPMLLQMPILFAAFRFFPAAIELRGESFAWATDLSTYDSILDLPFSIPFYGDHVSLFCLLMALTQVFYTKYSMPQQTNQQMPGMQWMMYLMPVMLLFFFNDYPAGLCYYYFLSTLITVLQTIVIRKFFIDEKKILAQIESNKKRPVKKGRFQEMYERKLKELQQQQQGMQGKRK